MITSKQRSYLRGLANKIDPIFQLGKGGITTNFIEQINQALEKRELIKIHVLNNVDDEKDIKEYCYEITEKTASQPVQVIGRKIVIYKESKENKTIDLPMI